MHYRPLDSNRDWEFFDSDFAGPSSYLAHIRPLTTQSAAVLWSAFVSQEAKHPMKLSGDAWPSQLYSSQDRADWLADWNDDTSTVFSEWLRAVLPWSPDASVLFTESSLRSTGTSWRVFVRC